MKMETFTLDLGVAMSDKYVVSKEAFKGVTKANTEFAEKCVELEEIRASLEKKNFYLEQNLKLAVSALEFYANPESWLQNIDERYTQTHRIDSDDWSDYPHITREVRSCGGKLARETLAKIKAGK